MGIRRPGDLRPGERSGAFAPPRTHPDLILSYWLSHLPDRRYGLPAGVEAGGPAGVDGFVWSEPGVEAGGPAGVDVVVWSEPGVEAGGPDGTEEGFPAGTELGGPLGLCASLFPESLVPVFPEVPLPGVTLAQNDATPALPAAFCRFLKATLLALGCPLLAV
jgi:hypothetical protein